MQNLRDFIQFAQFIVVYLALVLAPANVFCQPARLGSSFEILEVTKNAMSETINGSCSITDISADGRYILFTSEATNILPVSSTASENLFLYDRVSKSFELVGLNANKEAAEFNILSASMDANARYIVYSTANDASTNIYREGLSMYLLDRDTDFVKALNPGFALEISADGNLLLYVDYLNLGSGTYWWGSDHSIINLNSEDIVYSIGLGAFNYYGYKIARDFSQSYYYYFYRGSDKKHSELFNLENDRIHVLSKTEDLKINKDIRLGLGVLSSNADYKVSLKRARSKCAPVKKGSQCKKAWYYSYTFKGKDFSSKIKANRKIYFTEDSYSQSGRYFTFFSKASKINNSTFPNKKDDRIFWYDSVEGTLLQLVTLSGIPSWSEPPFLVSEDGAVVAFDSQTKDQSAACFYIAEIL